MVVNAQKSLWVHVCVALLVVAFLLFAHAAEAITDALDYDDVDRYMTSMVEYNLGVISLLVCLALILFFNKYRVVALIPLLGTIHPWAKDVWWLLLAPKKEREQYKRDLCQPG